MTEALIVLIFAFVLDLYFGDPVYALHPVRLIGKWVQKVEEALTTRHFNSRLGGLGLVLVTLTGVIAAYVGIQFSVSGFMLALVLNTFLVYSSISVQDLIKHGKKVLRALENDQLEIARNEVRNLIGRDANTLDEYGIARATVESLAENFVDAFLAPLFWFVIGGIVFYIIELPPVFGGTALTLFFRTANTLDSMVGYKNEKYVNFGWASAKLDDGLNFIPARLSMIVIPLSAQICLFDGKKSLAVGWRDRLKHRSPNAGHAEACVAGALNLKLNGPGIYPHGKVDKPWLGDGTPEARPKHIMQASQLVLCSAFLTVAVFAGILFLF